MGRDIWISPSSTCTPGNPTGVPVLHGLSSPQGNFINYPHFPISFVCGDWNDQMIAIATGKSERQQIRNDRKAGTTGKLKWRKDGTRPEKWQQQKRRDDGKAATTWRLAEPVNWANSQRNSKTSLDFADCFLSLALPIYAGRFGAPILYIGALYSKAYYRNFAVLSWNGHMFFVLEKFTCKSKKNIIAKVPDSYPTTVSFPTQLFSH